LKKRFPENLEVAANLAEILMRDKPEQARAEIDQIIKTDSKKPYAQMLVGELQFYTGQYDAAETTFSNQSTMNALHPGPQYFLGRIAEVRGNLDLAQDHYQKALTVDGGYVL